MKFIILFFCFISLQLLAEDLITTDGKVYKNYYIMGIKSSHITIGYDGGLVKISYKKLPEDIKKKYNISAEKLKKLKQKEKQAEQEGLNTAKKKEAEKKLTKITRIFTWFDGYFYVDRILSASSLIAEISNKRSYKYIIIEDYPNAKKMVDREGIPKNYTYKKYYPAITQKSNSQSPASLIPQPARTETITGLRLFYIGPKRIHNTTYPCYTANKNKAIEYLIKNPQATKSPL